MRSTRTLESLQPSMPSRAIGILSIIVTSGDNWAMIGAPTSYNRTHRYNATFSYN